MKKVASTILASLCFLVLLTGCSKNNAADAPPEPENTSAPQQGQAAEPAPTGDFNTSIDMTVVSREDGSGTRGAFIELFGVEEKQDDGSKLDKTTLSAAITNSTSVMMTTVSSDIYAIGYISLGSLNDTVKALEIDGVAPSVESVSSGEYKIARPFNIAVTDDVSDAAQDFIDYILSSDGQAIVEANGYIPLESTSAYAGTKPEGKVVVAGSSSVTPVMEKLKEGYDTVNPNAEIEIQQSDSSTGMSSAIEGICDIGMASRELKDSELDAGLTPIVIAMDGIAVIVNNDNPVTGLTSEQVKAIYVGEAVKWSDIA